MLHIVTPKVVSFFECWDSSAAAPFDCTGRGTENPPSILFMVYDGAQQEAFVSSKPKPFNPRTYYKYVQGERCQQQVTDLYRESASGTLTGSKMFQPDTRTLEPIWNSPGEICTFSYVMPDFLRRRTSSYKWPLSNVILLDAHTDHGHKYVDHFMFNKRYSSSDQWKSDIVKTYYRVEKFNMTPHNGTNKQIDGFACVTVQAEETRYTDGRIAGSYAIVRNAHLITWCPGDDLQNNLIDFDFSNSLQSWFHYNYGSHNPEIEKDYISNAIDKEIFKAVHNLSLSYPNTRLSVGCITTHPSTQYVDYSKRIDGISAKVFDKVFRNEQSDTLWASTVHGFLRDHAEWGYYAADAYENVRKYNFNLLQYIHDWVGMSELIKGSVRSVKNLVRAAATNNDKQYTQEVAGIFLSIHYGYKLQASDTVDPEGFIDLARWIMQYDGSPPANTTRCIGSKRLMDVPITDESNEAYFRYTVLYNENAQYRGIDLESTNAEFVSQLRKYLKIIDLEPNLENLWDAIPFSFVADWFFHIGDMFNMSADYNYLKEVHEVINCTKTYHTVIYDAPIEKLLYDGPHRTHEQLVGSITHECFVRENFIEPIAPAYDYTNLKPLNAVKHWVEGAALCLS